MLTLVRTALVNQVRGLLGEQGDGIIAFFGWPTAYGDDAEWAVRAGLSLPEVVEKANRGAPAERRIAMRGFIPGPSWSGSWAEPEPSKRERSAKRLTWRRGFRC